ncbi:hypothetical protein [Hoyosella altamirensis]|uniref:Uncharacterized protein n=1 Tax=Hoyosella altamirensis TaxID=616997 RepID=A0A839RH77_9ACTN|nr:hypothetical protein [Hoyosella altamirensis]MBB3035770.1 hypothetical protein [Hoyosella altamirensis]
MTSSTSVPAPARRTRGRSKTANWRRPEQVAVIALELDVSADSVMRRRVEQHWSAVFRLRRALQRDARNACTAYLAAHRERETGYKAVLARLGLSRKGVEARAKTHAEDSGWMRDHLTKATGLHVADEVWETCDRFLFPDRTGKRFGTPQIGSWWNFARIPGRARSHTKTQPTWETYRLVGTLQGPRSRRLALPGSPGDPRPRVDQPSRRCRACRGTVGSVCRGGRQRLQHRHRLLPQSRRLLRRGANFTRHDHRRAESCDRT